MMTRRLTISLFLVFVLCGICVGRGPLANDKKDGLYVKSIEQILRLEPSEIDLGIAALIVSEQWSDMVAGRRYQMQLDDMAYDILERMEEKGVGRDYRAISVINDYLFEELGYKSIKEANNPDDLFLHHVMDNKKGYCLSLSMLYLSIGERIGLPLYGVVVPGHFFVRYDDGDNIRFNIETTSKGLTAPDEHYIDKFKVPANDTLYLKNLNPLETLGCFFNNLGNSYMSVDDMSQAQLALERAVEINPGLAESRTNLGNVYMQANRLNDAIYQYSLAIKINSEDATIYNNLGNAYVSKKDYIKAERNYKISISVDNEFMDAYKNLALVYIRQEKYSLAIANIRQGLRIEPKSAELYYLLGSVYREQGNYESAMTQLKKAISYDEKMAEAYHQIGLCYKGLEVPELEVSYYEQALEITPGMTEVITSLGNYYFESQNYSKARDYYLRAAEQNPNNALVYYNIAASYSNDGDHAKAKDYYAKSLELNNNLGDAHHGIAYSYYMLEDYKSSLAHLTVAAKLGVSVDPELLEAVQQLAK